MDYFNAFWVGGLICALVQILLEKTKLLPGRVMVLLVCVGAVISFFGNLWHTKAAEDPNGLHAHGSETHNL